MIKKQIIIETSIITEQTKEGETIETKCARILSNKEPITDGAPIIYMERKDGVNPDTDIRSDRFDYAIEGMDAVTKSKIAKRGPQPAKEAEKTQGTEPPQGAA